jgi:hypothetical protein
MFTLECRVGCLVETRVMTMRSKEDVAALTEAFAQVARSYPTMRFVICGDYRRFSLLAPAVAEQFLGMFRQANPRVRRSGVLVTNESPTAALQVERIVSEAAHPERRAFRSSALCEAWLDDALTPEERTRMRAFLIEGR